MQGRSGAPQRGADPGAVLADQVHGGAALAHERRERREVLGLAAPAGDQVHAAGVGAQRDDRARDVRRLRVVDVANRAALVDQLEAVGDAAEAAQAGRHGVGLEAAREAGRRRGHRVLEVVRARQRELRHTQQLAAVPAQPAVAEPQAGGGAVPEAQLAGATADGHVQVVGKDGDILGALAREDPQLGRLVGLEAAVSIEMIRGHVEEHGDLGGERDGVLQLEGRGLADHRRVRLQLADEPGERRADVPGDGDGGAGSTVDVADPLGRGRLAVRSGHGDEGVVEEPPRQLELADDRDAVAACGQHTRSAGGNARALDERLDSGGKSLT